MCTCGFIGTGHMGGALAQAVAKVLPAQQLVLHNRTAKKAEDLAQKLGCKAGSLEQAASCDYIFLGVKPQMLETLFEDLAPILKARKDPFVLVSMAAARSLWDIHRMAGEEYPVIRIMPNTPVQVGSGIVLYCLSEQVTEAQEQTFLKLMERAGMCDRLAEHQMDAGSALAGCGPAFACLFMEALADGGVACGLTRDQALDYARQMLLGTAELAQHTGIHPAQLKDAVCSPGGSTIAGVQALEEASFRGAVMGAVKASFEKTKKM